MCPRVQSSLQSSSLPLSAGQALSLDFLWGFQGVVLPHSYCLLPPVLEMEKLSLKELKQIN